MGDPVEVREDPADVEPPRLPGELESETSPLLEDAQHWLHVYSELLAHNQLLLRAELERLSSRHRFWQARVELLRRSTRS